MKHLTYIIFIIIYSFSNCSKIEPEIKELYSQTENVSIIEHSNLINLKVSDFGVLWFYCEGERQHSFLYRYNGEDFTKIEIANPYNRKIGLNGEELYIIEEISNVYDNVDGEFMLTVFPDLNDVPLHYALPDEFTTQNDYIEISNLDINGAFVLYSKVGQSQHNIHTFNGDNWNTYTISQSTIPNEVVNVRNNYIYCYNDNDGYHNIYILNPITGENQSFNLSFTDYSNYNFEDSEKKLLKITDNGDIYYFESNKSNILKMDFTTGGITTIAIPDYFTNNSISPALIAKSESNNIWLIGYKYGITEGYYHGFNLFTKDSLMFEHPFSQNNLDNFILVDAGRFIALDQTINEVCNLFVFNNNTLTYNGQVQLNSFTPVNNLDKDGNVWIYIPEYYGDDQLYIYKLTPSNTLTNIGSNMY